MKEESTYPAPTVTIVIAIVFLSLFLAINFLVERGERHRNASPQVIQLGIIGGVSVSESELEKTNIVGHDISWPLVDALGNHADYGQFEYSFLRQPMPGGMAGSKMMKLTLKVCEYEHLHEGRCWRQVVFKKNDGIIDENRIAEDIAQQIKLSRLHSGLR